jgi:hypothetical protein
VNGWLDYFEQKGGQTGGGIFPLADLLVPCALSSNEVAAIRMVKMVFFMVFPSFIGRLMGK